MENDDKRTGRNIRAIRNANQIKLGDFAQNLGLSESLLSKIESGARPASDDLLFRIANYAGVSYSQIKYGDLSRLEKGELYMEAVPFVQFTDIVFEEIRERFAVIFPIAADEKAMSIEDFQSGVRFAREKMQHFKFTVKECLSALNSFIRASTNEACADFSHINMLSCYGYLYVFKYKAVCLDKKIERIADEKFNSLWEYLWKYNSNMDMKLAAETKKEFLDKHGKNLSAAMYQLTQSRDNADYAYYYLALRYLFGMMDESITLFGEEQMALFGESMLDSLWKMGNKYALAWHELQEDD